MEAISFYSEFWVLIQIFNLSLELSRFYSYINAVRS